MGIRDLQALTDEQKRQIQRVHLLLVMYNAFQPGVFALSGWDLVGALPLPHDAVGALIADGDTRWIDRGAYDLVNVNPGAHGLGGGLAEGSDALRSDQRTARAARLIRQPIAEDARRPASQRLYASHQILVPDVKSPGLLAMVHELPDGKGIQVTALNFGATPIDETIVLPNVRPGPVVDMINETNEGDLSAARRTYASASTPTKESPSASSARRRQLSEPLLGVR